METLHVGIVRLEFERNVLLVDPSFVSSGAAAFELVGGGKTP